jgi:hypothetical protein
MPPVGVEATAGGTRILRIYVDECAQLRIELRDSREERIHHVDRREALRGDRAREVVGGSEARISGHSGALNRGGAVSHDRVP